MKKAALRCTNPHVGENIAAYEFGWLGEFEKAQFQWHLRECPSCAEDVKSMEPVWHMLKMNPEILANPERYAPRRASSWLGFLQNAWKPSLVAALSILLLLGVALVRTEMQWQSTGPINGLEVLHLRGNTGPLIHEGLLAMRNKDLDRANEKFQQAIKQAPDSYEAHYLSGVTQLLEAKKGFFRVNESKVNASIEEFSKAAEIARDLDHRIYLAQCHYQLACAYVMKKDLRQASEQLTKVERLDGTGPELSALKEQATQLKAELSRNPLMR